MADIHHFAYGWINPILSYVLSFLGCMLGLLLVSRSRESTGLARARWLFLAAVAIGGTGIWLMHFMAILGFDVPQTVVRYDLWLTVASFVIAVTIVALGLFAVGFGGPSLVKIIMGGFFTGLGVAAMHYTGMAAMHVGGDLVFNPQLVGVSVGIAVVASVVALWFAVVVRGSSATIGAAALMAIAVSSMHYTGMAAVEVRLRILEGTVPGFSAFELLAPISIIACVVISALAYATVGFSVRKENRREEVLLSRAANFQEATALLQGRAAARHR